MFVVAADARLSLRCAMKPIFDPQNLINLRHSHHWTQEELSAASGVSTRTIQRIEREGGGSFETWKALAAAFDVDIKLFEMRRDYPPYSLSEIKLGRAGLIFASVWSGLGCALPWGAAFMEMRAGYGFIEIWPFVVLGLSLSLMCLVILMLGWRRFNRMARAII